MKNKVIMSATQLHEGWEMDNEVWIEDVDDGYFRLYSTSHGAKKEISQSVLEKKIQETRDSLFDLELILAKTQNDYNVFLEKE